MSSTYRGTVAITGAAGVIANAVRPGLEKLGYATIGIDRPIPQSQGGPLVDSSLCTNIDAVDRICDFSDANACKNIFEGCTHVIHLAGQGSPNAAFLDDILPNNVLGMYNACEAAKASGTVHRFVFASSNHTQHGGVKSIDGSCGSLDSSRLLRFPRYKKVTEPDSEPPIRTKTAQSWSTLSLTHSHANSASGPDSFYAVSKLFGEQLGTYYSRIENSFDFVSLRLGWCLYDDPTILKGSECEDYLRSIWLSKRDCLGFIAAALETNTMQNNMDGSIVAYATSNNDRNIYDISESCEILNYFPIDSSEQFNWDN